MDYEPDEDRMEQRRRWNKRMDDLIAEMESRESEPARGAARFAMLPNMAMVSAAAVERLSEAAGGESERAYIDAAWDRVWGR